MISVVWSATCFSVFLARTSGVARASSTVSGSSGQSGVSGAYPASLKSCPQRSQLLGNSQRPWMKTTGVLPEAFAASISRFSRSEIDAMPNSSRSVISIPDPVHGLFILTASLCCSYIPSSLIRSDTSIK
jgi:hypothetical protein